MIRACKSEADFQQLLSDSQEKPVFLLKHSTRCPISAGAHARFDQFASDEGDAVECWQVLVIENRALSSQIAEYTGIAHQSPQAILFKAGRAVWHTSHGSVTGHLLRDALALH